MPEDPEDTDMPSGDRELRLKAVGCKTEDEGEDLSSS